MQIYPHDIAATAISCGYIEAVFIVPNRLMSIIARHRLHLCMSKIAADFTVGQGFKHLKKQKVVF